MPTPGFVCKTVTLVYCLAFVINPTAASTAMKRLYEDLFTDYNRLILPVANNRTKVKVTLGLKLGQILDLNLKQQILSTNVWVEQTWHDYKLEWSPDLYEGIDMIHVPAENLWIPDIVLFNNADGNYELTLVAKARVYYNGTVVWKPPTMFRSTCEIDVEYFPFDIQTCFLRFGSWTYAGDEVELQHVGNKRKVEIGIDLSQFYKNVEWDIIDVPAYYNEVYYECCTEPYPDITFKIVIRRKMLFYLVNLILPVALMTFMTVSVFYLPSDSNEKVTLSISILTSLIVFFLLMLEIIPASSLAVPLFGKYLLFTLVLVSLSACVSVYVLNIHHRCPSVHAMSPRTRKIFLEALPRLLHLNRPDPRERSSLNRFRKKKVAQQLLAASSTNKVYDLAQPLAASLNLIETLHKSYEFNPKDDELQTEDEGRYFRRYVDNYISRLKKVGGEEGGANYCACNTTNAKPYGCCEHKKCCSQANQSWQRHLAANRQRLAASCCGTNVDLTESSADMMCPLMPTQVASFDNSSSCNNKNHNNWPRNRPASAGYQNGCSCAGRQSCRARMPNDDTLDMTFDYDEQDNNGLSAVPDRCPAANLSAAPNEDQGLPSPPPPPRQVAHLQSSNSGRLSSCGKSVSTNSPRKGFKGAQTEAGEPLDNGQLVDKLLSSIYLLDNGSDEVDTTTTSGNNEPDDVDHLMGSSTNANSISQNTVIYAKGQNKIPDYVSPLNMVNTNCALNAIENYTTSNCQPRQLNTQQRLQSHPGFSCEKRDCDAPEHGAVTTTNTIARELNCHCALAQSKMHLPNQQWRSSSVSSVQQPSQAHEIGKAARVEPQETMRQPSDLLLSLRLAYDQMPAEVRAAIRSILFIADTIKNEDDENSAIEDWESMSMVVDRLFLWIFFLLCTFGSVIILALAPSLYDQRASIDDKLRIDIPPSNCSASVYAH